MAILCYAIFGGEPKTQLQPVLWAKHLDGYSEEENNDPAFRIKLSGSSSDVWGDDLLPVSTFKGIRTGLVASRVFVLQYEKLAAVVWMRCNIQCNKYLRFVSRFHPCSSRAKEQKEISFDNFQLLGWQLQMFLYFLVWQIYRHSLVILICHPVWHWLFQHPLSGNLKKGWLERWQTPWKLELGQTDVTLDLLLFQRENNHLRHHEANSENSSGFCRSII